jgi:hypothetical protein
LTDRTVEIRVEHGTTTDEDREVPEVGVEVGANGSDTVTRDLVGATVAVEHVL